MKKMDVIQTSLEARLRQKTQKLIFQTFLQINFVIYVKQQRNTQLGKSYEVVE